MRDFGSGHWVIVEAIRKAVREAGDVHFREVPTFRNRLPRDPKTNGVGEHFFRISRRKFEAPNEVVDIVSAREPVVSGDRIARRYDNVLDEGESTLRNDGPRVQGTPGRRSELVKVLVVECV